MKAGVTRGLWNKNDRCSYNSFATCIPKFVGLMSLLSIWFLAEFWENNNSGPRKFLVARFLGCDSRMSALIKLMPYSD